MKVAILAIGTEVTDGEILNANAQTLAHNLTELNFRVWIHLSVPDDFKSIHKAIEFCAESCDLLVFTGGLGPTLDDITRNVVAQWAGEPLEVSESEYSKVLEKLKTRGRETMAGHKNQSEFPRGSEILDNPAGTAAAFWLEARNKVLVCLPGPPKEIQGVWDHGLLDKLSAIAPKEKLVLKRWVCEGTGESVIAEIVEDIFKDSSWELGFRASHPQVHVKLWVPEGELAEAEAFISEVSDKLKQWIVDTSS